MHYFDTRGVYRLFELTVAANGWAIAMGLHGDGVAGARRVRPGTGQRRTRVPVVTVAPHSGSTY
jgi:hypothetical protein